MIYDPQAAHHVHQKVVVTATSLEKIVWIHSHVFYIPTCSQQQKTWHIFAKICMLALNLIYIKVDEELRLYFPIIQTFCFYLPRRTFYKQTVQPGTHDDFTFMVSLFCCLSHSRINEWFQGRGQGLRCWEWREEWHKEERSSLPSWKEGKWLS